ncbi:MAG TPA: hemolysin family protein [Acidimicrobiales bacterium]
MTTSQTVMIAVIFVMLLALVFLALAETALTRMTRTRAQALVEEGRPGAKRLQRLVEHPERFLNVVLLVVLVCATVQATLTGIVAAELFGGLGVAIGTFINVVVVFVLAEAAPKTWAIEHPDKAALIAAPPIGALSSFWPLRILSRGLIGLTNVILPGKGLKEGPFVSEEELLAIVGAAADEEVIEQEERELISQIIEFGDTIVREVMVPRPDMITVDSDFRVADVMEVVLLNGRSRVPVCGEGIDDIVGVVYALDLMRAERDGRDDEMVTVFLREARYVPETKRIAALLPEMQAQQFHMAIVVDEYGGTAGLVTMEDLIEELVGEIVDEFDREDPLTEVQADGSVNVQAKLPVDEVNELLDAELPEGDWDTIGGLMFHLLGHVPDEGESADVADHRLWADRVQGRRIEIVRIARLVERRRDDEDDRDRRTGAVGGEQARDARETAP